MREVMFYLASTMRDLLNCAARDGPQSASFKDMTAKCPKRWLPPASTSATTAYAARLFWVLAEPRRLLPLRDQHLAGRRRVDLQAFQASGRRRQWKHATASSCARQRYALKDKTMTSLGPGRATRARIVGLTPAGAKALLDAGIRVTVEDSHSRALPLQGYIDAGCEIAAENSWPDAPRDASSLA